MYPARLETTFLDTQTLHCLQEWLTIFANDNTATKRERIEEPCVPIGMLGPSIIFGHYQTSLMYQNSWNLALFPHILISKEQYQSILMSLQGLDIHQEFKIPSPDILDKQDFFQFLLEGFVIEDSMRPLLQSFKYQSDYNLHELPEGYAMYYHYLCNQKPVVPLSILDITDACFDSIPKTFQEHYYAIPFHQEGSTLYVATKDGKATELEDLMITRSSGAIKEVFFCMASQALIEDKRRECLQKKKKASAVFKKVDTELEDRIVQGTLTIDVKQMDQVDLKKSMPTPEVLFQWILYTAINREATDIHLEQCYDRGRIRLRVDGDLFVFFETNYENIRALVTVCKNICSMSANDFDNQDAAFSVNYEGQKINLRVNAIPFRSSFQKLAIRILPRNHNLTTLDKLGIAKDHLKLLRRAITRKQGLILATGPTGEGKSTTLYAALSEINKPGINIQTIEDPIEREIEGINQTAINLARDITFGKLMRSIVRQDPNVILLGEIRDQESAELAVEAAITGHLVFATLHANSALKAIQRMIQLKVPHYLLADSLLLIQAQRLIKRLCHRCKHSRSLTEEEQALFKAQALPVPDQLYDPVGCPSCEHTGYSGRIAIMELFPVNAALEKKILDQASFLDIQDYTREEGMRNLFQDALIKCSEGLTSLEQATLFEEVWT